jgi:hypothetical protein
VICEACKSEGKKSHVFPGMTMSTAAYCAPFYDEEGRLHSHDSNIRTTDYRCSNGHAWTVCATGSCWCGWPTERQGDPK